MHEDTIHSDKTPKGIPLTDIIEAVETHNLSIPQAAKLLGCSERNIYARLEQVGLRPGQLQKYKDHRADILASYQQIILNSFTKEDLKKAGLSQKIMAYGVLYDKERLERGQSTDNIAYMDMVKARKVIAERVQNFELAYGVKPETPVSSNE